MQWLLGLSPLPQQFEYPASACEEVTMSDRWVSSGYSGVLLQRNFTNSKITDIESDFYKLNNSFCNHCKINSLIVSAS